MLSRIEFKNYRSFLDVKVNLSPFTLVIGANGSGKSNFLRLFYTLTNFRPFSYELENSPSLFKTWLTSGMKKQKHFNNKDKPQFIQICTVAGDNIIIKDTDVENFKEIYLSNGEKKKEHTKVYALFDSMNKIGSILNESTVGLFTLNSYIVAHPEMIQEGGKIASNGQGIISILDDLRTGDREDLFYEIEKNWMRYIPSIEKLSLRISGTGQKILQVREKGIKDPFPVAELSEGTKLILMILTILYQENPPKLILLEDIDRGLHPRLFQKVVEMLRDIVKTKDIQIIATTHNPYLVDEFDGEEESVLIVEKQNAVSTITSLAERLDNGNTMEDALGSLWFGGFFGGVPKS